MEEKQKLLGLEGRIEDLVVAIEAALLGLVKQSSRFTRTLETAIHDFIMDATLLKSHVTAVFEGSAPQDDAIYTKYEKLRALRAHLSSTSSAFLTSSRAEKDDEQEAEQNKEKEQAEVDLITEDDD